jgi:hypothetical protein
MTLVGFQTFGGLRLRSLNSGRLFGGPIGVVGRLCLCFDRMDLVGS